jgi:hypothetical protein
MRTKEGKVNFDKAEASSGVHFSLAKEETLVSFPFWDVRQKTMRNIGGYLGEGIDGKARSIGKDRFFPAQLRKRLCGA